MYLCVLARAGSKPPGTWRIGNLLDRRMPIKVPGEGSTSIRHGKPDRKRRTFLGLFDFDLATLYFDCPLRDRKPQARSNRIARSRRIQPVKPIKDFAPVLRGMPAPNPQCESLPNPNIRRMPNVADVYIPQDLDYPALRLDIDRARAGELGLSEKEVMSNVITALTSNQMIAPSIWSDPRNDNNYYLAV